ncbi:MAG: hypothetical protein HY591_01810 [Candidatus Omnitrophica bacterium]|nr:hypothetical protein [Candidatus Omnitrophota bacterium]
MFWVIILGFAVLMAIVIVIYMMPSETETKAKKKEKTEKEDRAQMIPDATRADGPHKDWEAIAKRWERNNNTLLAELEKIKIREKSVLKEIEEHKVRNKEALDKLTLERQWREKEQVNLDKARHHEKDLKGQVVRAEKDLEREHSNRLRLERELQELKIKHDVLSEAKRAAFTKAMSLETTVGQLSSEVKELKRQNEQLKKKREDVQWVAKSEFDELKKQYNELKEKGLSPP